MITRYKALNDRTLGEDRDHWYAKAVDRGVALTRLQVATDTLSGAAQEAKDALDLLLRPDARDGQGDLLRWTDHQRHFIEDIRDRLELGLRLIRGLEPHFDYLTAPRKAGCLEESNGQ